MKYLQLWCIKTITTKIKIMKKILLISLIGLFSCTTSRPPTYIIVNYVKHSRSRSFIRGIDLRTCKMRPGTYDYPCSDVRLGDTLRVYSNLLVMPKF